MYTLLYVSSAGGSWKGEKANAMETFKRGDTKPKCSLIAQERMELFSWATWGRSNKEIPCSVQPQSGRLGRSCTLGNGFWGSSCPRISLAANTFLLPSSNFL